MYEEFTRAMNDAERSALEARLAAAAPAFTLGEILKATAIWSIALVMGVALMAGILTTRLHVILKVIALAPLLTIVCICLLGLTFVWRAYRYGAREHRRFMAEGAVHVRRAIDAGRVRVKHATATAVVTVGEYGGEDAACIFDVGDGRLLALKGWHYLPVAEDMPWPAAEFEIVRTEHGDHWVGLFARGEPLAPRRRIDIEQCRATAVRADGEQIVEADLNEYTRSVLGAPEPG